MFNVPFVDFLPEPRSDGAHWSQVEIKEGPSKDGPWTVIDLIDLIPADTDPTNPAVRDFSTDNATLEEGWYLVTFIASNGSQQQPTAPLHHVLGSRPEVWPSISDVGALLRSRTTNVNGQEIGTFTGDTRPTAAQVERLIGEAARDVGLSIGIDIPDRLVPAASGIVKLLSAMYVELSYFPEQVATGRSAYAQYKELYDQQLPVLIKAVQAAELEDSVDDTTQTGGFPQFSFPVDGGGLIGWGTRW